MMRSLIKRSIVTMAAVVGVLGLSSAATALTVDLEWVGSGTALTGTLFTGTETVTLQVYASWSAPPPTVMAVVVSISWDSDALSLMSCDLINKQVAGGAKFQPVGGAKALCPGASPGLQPGIDQLAAWAPTAAGTVHIGDLVFHVVGLAGNSLVDPFMSVNDGWADGNWTVSFNAVFNNATVHVIPEPATAILVGVGFLGLLAAGRRARRRS